MPPAPVQEEPVPFIESKLVAKRRIRRIAKCDKGLHRFQRTLFRGKLMKTRSVQWQALVAMVHHAMERCRVAVRNGVDTSAHHTVEQMWWHLAPRWNGNTPTVRARMVYILETAIDVDVVGTNLSEWPDIVTLALYPRACAHLISGSLGYATADRAARMIATVHDKKPVFNEWAYDYAQRSFQKTVETDRLCRLNTGHEGGCDFDAEWKLDLDKLTDCCFGRCHTKERIPNPKSWDVHQVDAARVLTQNCLRSQQWGSRRDRHRGYMADYGQARVVVLRELLGKTPNGTLAAWF